VVTRSEIEEVTADQCRKAWRRFVGRDNLFVTVVGDFDKKQVLEIIEAKFKDFQKAEDKHRVWFTRDPVLRPGVFMVEKDLAQLAVRLCGSCRWTVPSLPPITPPWKFSITSWADPSTRA